MQKHCERRAKKDLKILFFVWLRHERFETVFCGCKTRLYTTLLLVAVTSGLLHDDDGLNTASKWTQNKAVKKSGAHTRQLHATYQLQNVFYPLVQIFISLVIYGAISTKLLNSKQFN